jgi:hypothetical protein
MKGAIISTMSLFEIASMSDRWLNVPPNAVEKSFAELLLSGIWPVHLVWMTARLQQDTFLSWHLAPASEVAGGHTLPF